MIIGREEEIARLKKAYASDNSEFVAIYGRRRVGKTFLVRETFENSFTFYHTGLSNSPLKKQLANWQSSLKEYNGGKRVRFPRTWLDAFDMLKQLIKDSKDEKKVVFIDELPWMDTPKSGFVAALEHFWNGWASARNDVLLITCGSATSWIINKLIKNKGGLHNRVTIRIPVRPFVLRECEAYAEKKKFGFTRRQIMQCYMVMGGIPYYWSYIDREMSLAQNIDNLFFNPLGQLFDEFGELYASLFKKPALYIQVIETLTLKRVGLTREEIISEGKDIIDNGNLSQVLEELEYCGFIRKYVNFGYTTKNAIYQLVDPYTLFYYKFISENKHKDPHFWSSSQDSPTFYNWVGLAFERVCLDHVTQIKKALGVEGVISNEYSWQAPNIKEGEKKRAQIDLLIDRNDDIIDLCEMKCTKLPYQMTAEESDKIEIRRKRFREVVNTDKSVQVILVSAAGAKRNQHTENIQKIIDGDALFT